MTTDLAPATDTTSADPTSAVRPGAGKPGAGKPGAGKPGARRSTSALIWLAGIAIVLVTLTLRGEQLRGTIAEQVAASDAGRSLTDPALTELSVNIGFYLAIVLSGAVTAMYFSLASVAESRIFPALLWSVGNMRVGFLGLAAIISVVGVQVVSLLFAVTSPKDQWQTYLFVAVVGLATPFLFRRHWLGRPARAIAAIFGASALIAATSLLL
jgi:hypothetical protein